MEQEYRKPSRFLDKVTRSMVHFAANCHETSSQIVQNIFFISIFLTLTKNKLLIIDIHVRGHRQIR